MPNEPIDDFFKDTEDDLSAKRTQVEYDKDGNISNTWEPGSEKDYVDTANKNNKDVEIEFEEDEDGEEDIEEEKEEPVVAAKKEEPAPQQKEKESRSQERIRQLARERREERERAERAEQEKLALQLAYSETMLKTTDNEIAGAEADIKRAMEDQDADLFAKAQRTLIEAQTRKQQLNQALEYSKRNLKPIEDRKITSSDTTNNPDLPEAAVEWLKTKKEFMDMNEYKKLPKELRKNLLPVRQMAFELANTLKAEGYDPSYEDFYDELDLRLSMKFDFYDELASLGVDGVDFSSKDAKKSKSSDETLKPQKNSTKDKAARIPVSASSPSSAPSGKSNNSVKIDAEQLQFFHSALKHRYMQTYGLTEEQALKRYAKEIKESQ